MNIAVVNIRDIIKYAIRIGILIFLIWICIQIIKIPNISRNDNNLKKSIEKGVNKINQHPFTECLDISISLMSYNKKIQEEKNILTSSKILAMGAGIFDESIFADTDLVIDEKELTMDDAEELANQISEPPDNVTVESVSENNITPKVTTSYGSVQINNQSDYELTEDMLIPDVEITNKKDILIYHTHTCESYTSSPRI